MEEEWKDFEGLQLAGVEWDPKRNDIAEFFFIMSNGKKSELKSPSIMQPYLLNLQGKTLRKVQMYHNSSCLCGMRFYDQNQSLVLEVGRIEETMNEVVLEEDERIIGFKARNNTTDKT